MQPSVVRAVLPSVLSAALLVACSDQTSHEGEDTSEVTLRFHTESRSRQLPAAGDQPLPDPPAADAQPVAGENGPAARGQCDPNYDPCVPIDSDVDCAGGKGNGPSFVAGPVRVVGRDVYGLDRDGDGIGCDR